MYKKIIAGVIAVAIILVLIFSGKQSPEEKPILGVIGPFTGASASGGESLQRSINLVGAENLNVIFEDDSCDTKKSVSAYQLLKERGAKLFYVGCSGSVMALAPLAKQNGDLIVTAYAGSSEIRKTGDEVIRFIPDALSVTEVINEYIASKPDTTFGVLYEVQDYSKSVLDSLVASSGEQIVLVEGYKSSDGSFKTIITKFKDETVDEIIFVPVSDTSAKIILQEMQTLGISKPMVGDVNVCDYPFMPNDYGLHGVCWRANLSTDGFKKFVQEFEEKYGVPPQYQFYDAVSFDLVKILDDIVGKTSDVSKIKTEILRGVSGEITDYGFEPNGEVMGGKYLEKIVF